MDSIERVAGLVKALHRGAADSAEAGTVAGRIESFGNELTFSSWMYQIVADLACKRLPTPQPTGNEIALDDVLPPFDGDGRHIGPISDWSGRLNDPDLTDELHRVMSDAIDALPVVHRTALVLRDIEGLTDTDIAETLGISPMDVRSRVHRSRLFLRKRLSEHFESE